MGLSDRIAALAQWQKMLLLGAGAAFVLSDIPQWTIDQMLYPWARANPPLLDVWVGSLTTGNGEPLDVAFVLWRFDTRVSEVCYRCSQIEGQAATCDASGHVRRYRVSGSPRDRHGRDLHLGFVPTPAPSDGLELSNAAGAWDGADALALDAEFFWRRGLAGISSTDDPATQPVPLAMARHGKTTINPRCAAIASDTLAHLERD
jgi:hypothetical protein